MCVRTISVFYVGTALVLASRSVAMTPAFDHDLYASVLDEPLCEQTLTSLTNDSRDIALRLLDASGRLPSGVLQGNLVDYGDYFECLAIDQAMGSGHRVRGKYCTVRVGLNVSAAAAVERRIGAVASQAIGWPDTLHQRTLPAMSGALQLSLGACVPRECRAGSLAGWLANGSGFTTVTEGACRLPGDRPWATADTLAIVVFSILAAMVVLSSGYELYHQYLLKKEKEELNPLYSSFSVLSNTRRLLSPGSGEALRAVDGVRALSMGWVVLGHAYAATAVSGLNNYTDVIQWSRAMSSVWVTAAPLAVDSFFVLSGMMLVYTATGRYTRASFISSLPLFYLHRLLRVFPLLAAVVLLQASLLHRCGDGPQWGLLGSMTEACRRHWWAALLHVQNYVTDVAGMCLPQSWYLSVDMQLYAASPLVLYWLLPPSPSPSPSPSPASPPSPLTPAVALLLALAVSLAASTAYSVIYDFPYSLMDFDRLDSLSQYMRLYYTNTGPRAPPYAVGMAAGYLLHRTRHTTVRLRKVTSCALMLSCLALMLGVAASERLVRGRGAVAGGNAGGRGGWAAGAAGAALLAVRGYGGPIRWFLSHPIWLVPARLSFAVYLTHLQIMMVTSASSTTVQRFTDANTLRRFLSDGAVSVLAAVALTLLVDAPASRLLGLLLTTGKQKKIAQEKTESQSTIAVNEKGVQHSILDTDCERQT